MPVLAAGIMLNVGAVALWAVTRTAGAPFGPHAGEAELVQAADLCALLLQIYEVMGAGWALYRGCHGQPINAFTNAIVFRKLERYDCPTTQIRRLRPALNNRAAVHRRRLMRSRRTRSNALTPLAPRG